jgi:ribosomal protein L13
LHSSLAYQDKEKCLYNLDGNIETSYKLSSSERYNKREFYFDWGNIDCGRQVIVIKCNNKISYKGKKFDIQQTRSYPIMNRNALNPKKQI